MTQTADEIVTPKPHALTLVRQCSTCPDMINPKRLLALPNTRFCIKCQEQAEAEAPKTEPVVDAYLNRLNQTPKNREVSFGSCTRPERRIKAATFGLAHHIAHHGLARASVRG